MYYRAKVYNEELKELIKETYDIISDCNEEVKMYNDTEKKSKRCRHGLGKTY